MSENSKKPLFRTEAQCVGVRLVQCGNGVISLGSGQCHAATRRATTQLSRCSPAMLVPTHKKDISGLQCKLRISAIIGTCAGHRGRKHAALSFVTHVVKAFESPPTCHQAAIVCSHQCVFLRAPLTPPSSSDSSSHNSHQWGILNVGFNAL